MPLVFLFAVMLQFFVGSAHAEPEIFLKINGIPHLDSIWTAAVDSQGHYYTGSRDKTIKKWNLDNGTLVKTYRLPTVGRGDNGAVLALTVNDSNGDLAYASVNDPGSITVISTESAEVKKVIKINGYGLFYSLAYTTDGRHLLACGGQDAAGLTVYDASSYSVVHTDHSYNEACHSISIGTDNRFVTGATDGYLRLYDKDFSLIRKVKTQQGYKGMTVAFGKYIAVAFDWMKTSYLPAYIEFYNHELDYTFSSLEFFKANKHLISKGTISSIAWSGDYLYAGGSIPLLNEGNYMPLLKFEIENEVEELEVLELERMTDTVGALTPYNDKMLVSGHSGDWLVLQKDMEVEYSGKYRKDFRDRVLKIAKDGELIRIESKDKNDPIILEFDIISLRNHTNDQKSVKYIEYEPEWPEPKIFKKIKADFESGELYWWHKMSHQAIVTSKYLRILAPDGTIVTKRKLPSYPLLFAQTDKYIIICFNDDTVRWYSSQNGELLASLFMSFENEWVVWTSEGYFASSQDGGRLVGYHINIEEDRKAVYVVNDNIFDVFYRPDLVRLRLKGQDVSPLSQVRLSQVFGDMPPEVSLTGVQPAGHEGRVTVCYDVKSTGGGIGELRLFHNGKLFFSDGKYAGLPKSLGNKMAISALKGRSLMRLQEQDRVVSRSSVDASEKPTQLSKCYETYSIPGVNEYSAIAFNRTNTIASDVSTERYVSKASVKQSQLYILAVGIDRYKDPAARLIYASKDATDFIDRMEMSSRTLYTKNNIHIVRLTDKDASKHGIRTAFNTITAKIRPQDTLIFFVASHGVMVGEQYYMVTHDYEGELKASVLLGANEMIEFSKKNAALTQLFILDTCHAGGIDDVVSGLYDSRVSVMARKAGLHIYAAAKSKEQALDEYMGNGLFTHTLLEGLNNNRNVDQQNDGIVTITELGQFSSRMTSEISKKMGYEQNPMIMGYGEDSDLYKLP